MAAKAKDDTVLDAIEVALGAKPTRRDLNKLTMSEIEGIAASLEEFWRAQAEKAIEGGASLIGGWRSAYGSEPSLREDLSDSLLYYPKLLLLDPLADFLSDRSALPSPHGVRYRRRDGAYNNVSAGAELWSSARTFDTLRQDPESAVGRFAKIILNLYALDSPIRDGVVVLRSQWPILAQRRNRLDTAVRHDVDSRELQAFIQSIPPDQIGLTVWDNLQGLDVSLDGPIRTADAKWRNEPFFYYLDKMLAIADAFDAQYVPPTWQDLQFLRIKVNEGVPRTHPSGVLREVSNFLLPSIDAPIREAAAIRRSSDDFNEWRRALRSIERNASADSPEELRERVQDELNPLLSRVRRDLEKPAIRDFVKTDGADLIIDAAVGFGFAAGTGEPLWGVAAGATTGVLHWIRRAYTRPKPSGADAVLATLLRHES